MAIVLKIWQTCPQSGNYNQNVAINPQCGNNTQNVANMIIVMPNVDSFWMYIHFECTFILNVHSFWMYICYECTFVLNVHLWAGLPHFVGRFATFWVLLPHCGNVSDFLIMIATLWVCLPHFEYYCHTVAMFATFWLWLPLCRHVCHISFMIATLWACTFAPNVHLHQM